MRLCPAAILAAFLLLLVLPPAASQQPVCGDRDHIASELLRQHGEKPVARGVLLDGAHVLEVFAAPSGSFTVVITGTQGIACIPAAGLGWENQSKPPSSPL